MENECGVTEISLENARYLVGKYGIPDRIRLHNDPKEGHVVTVTWPHQGLSDSLVWDFTGFSWGYSGEGPHGLVKFFDLCHLNISIQEVASMDAEKEMVFNLDNAIKG